MPSARESNVADYFIKSYENGWSIFTATYAVPEPATYAVLLTTEILGVTQLSFF